DELPAAVARQPFDLVLLSCKAYDLDSAIEAVVPAMLPGTTLMPILNGLHHYPALDARFGRDNVLGGLCFISATLGEDGSILHLGRPASITFGERDGGSSARVEALPRCARRPASTTAPAPTSARNSGSSSASSPRWPPAPAWCAPAWATSSPGKAAPSSWPRCTTNALPWPPPKASRCRKRRAGLPAPASCRKART